MKLTRLWKQAHYQRTTSYSSQMNRLHHKHFATSTDGEYFDQQVKKLLKEKHHHAEILHLGKTPSILQSVGALDLPLTLQSVKFRHILQKHNVTPHIIRQLPENLANPVMIFESATQRDALVTITESQDTRRKPVLAAIHLGTEEEGTIVNRVASVYGKDNIVYWLLRQLDSGKLLYAHREKSLALSKALGVILPNEVAHAEFSHTIIRKLDYSNKKRVEKNMAKYSTNVTPGQSYVQALLEPKAHFFTENTHETYTQNLHEQVLDKIHTLLPLDNKVIELQKRREVIIREMQKNYSGFQLFHINAIGYRLDGRSPEQIIAEGGFLPKEDRVWISTRMDAPNNEGLVGFSLLPGVTCLFTENVQQQNKPYLYAVPIDIGYAMKGEWRQIVAPALPLPDWWCAKRVEAITQDGQITLGQSEGHHGEMQALYDEQFHAFLQGDIRKPKCIDYGSEDYSPVFEIVDSLLSEEFERIRKGLGQSISK